MLYNYISLAVYFHPRRLGKVWPFHGRLGWANLSRSST
jgi:hypothetical protein